MRSSKQPWVENFRLCRRFEAQARAAYPTLRRDVERVGRKSQVVYRLMVPIPEYAPRAIELQFQRAALEPTLMHVYADGPTDSPHRYPPYPLDPQRRSLCIWLAEDPPEMRWVPADGLLALINHTRIHLFKEAYWRETGEWLGPEAPHAAPAGGKAC